MAAPQSRMSRLGNLDAPFRFKNGDRVAWKRFDGFPDFEFAGEVVDAVCEHQPLTGFHKAVYIVRRSDGSYFPADNLELVRLAAVDARGSSRVKPGHPEEVTEARQSQARHAPKRGTRQEGGEGDERAYDSRS